MTDASVLFSLPFFGKNIDVTTWTLFGLLGNVLFMARVFVQWIASERAGRSVVPVAFWCMSFLASLIMIVYAIGRHDLPMVLGIAVTVVPYTRNLMIYYRPGRPPRNTAILVSIALGLVIILQYAFWRGEHDHNGLFYLGLVGNAVFASRFFIQWVQSERRRVNYMGLSFWYSSLLGSFLLLVYALLRRDLVFILSFVFNVIPYGRNIWLIHRHRKSPGGAALNADPATALRN